MKKPSLLSAAIQIAFLATLTLWAAAADAQDKPVRRWALLLSAEDGGQGRARLRYAQTDAQGVGRVLTQIGGVAPSDVRALHNPSQQDIRKALSALRGELERAKAEGRPTQLVLYYSGHSDEGGLLLGRERMDYRELRGVVESLPADVRVVILDSCASGALTRTKGGKVVPGFMQDASTQVQGQAILTSSSADEAAQESDRIGASFFTHALLTGLRGGADLSGDGRVTLNEAYQFAFNETLARTERTQGGAQHPAYELRLAGQGDLVLTDLTQATSALVLDRSLSGQLYVRDARGNLVVELSKNAGRAVELALPADTYTVRLVSGKTAREATIKLTSGQRLAPANWKTSEIEGSVASKGGDAEPLYVGVDLLPYIGTSSLAPDRPRHFSLNAIGGVSGGTQGLEIGPLNINQGDMFGVQIGAANLISGDVLGVQIGAGNVVSGDADGLLIGAANVTGGATRSAQVGAVNVAAEDSAGLQIAAVSAVQGDFKGVQVAAAGWGYDVTGMQIAAFGGAFGDMRGLQLTAIGVTTGDFTGFQLGAINVIGQKLKGFQLGAINMATGDTGGVQLGAINISKDADYALGAINIVTDGQTRAQSWLDDSGTLRAGVRHGGSHFYQSYFVGARALGVEDETDLNFGIGLGGIKALNGRWRVQGELMHHWFVTERSTWSSPTTINQARFLVGWQALPWLAVVGGPTVNVFLSEKDRASDFAPVGSWRLNDEDSQTDVSIWPGLSLGVELF